MLLIQVLVTTEYVWGSSSEIMLTLYMILLLDSSWNLKFQLLTFHSSLPPHPPMGQVLYLF